jgi:hypothetical protein
MAKIEAPKIDAPKPRTPADPSVRQRSRNIAIAIGLVVLVVLFYMITIFKMGGSALNKGI